MSKLIHDDLTKITVKINGEPFSCTSPIFLSQLLEYLDFNLQTIIVEHNSKIVNRNMLDIVQVENKDKIEIVTIVGGG
uniref:thiamine biosynthesis protein S n=1 Tax=Sahlingia subintegra TaxID=468936 RepID=UPI001FCD736B|nr:thiamine biosynthesis protein S [Sahlingia subintegra]UNJ17356.1 thiamine biosynthesis protein S [Sahlingia subintegra]